MTVKTCSSFLNYVSSTSLDIALKVSSSERRRVVLLMESVQISPCAFICEQYVENFGLKNYGLKIMVDISWPSLLNFASCTSSCSSSVRDCSNFSYNKPNLLSALVEIGCYTKQIGFLKRERCDLNSKLPWNVAARHSISRRVRRRDLFHHRNMRCKWPTQKRSRRDGFPYLNKSFGLLPGQGKGWTVSLPSWSETKQRP